MIKIYLSGKISGLSESEYKMNFHNSKLDAWKRIDAASLKDFINPLDLKPFLGIKSWLCYMITDLYYLRKCDYIAMQKNWIDSKGSVIEYFCAKFIFKLKIIWL